MNSNMFITFFLLLFLLPPSSPNRNDFRRQISQRLTQIRCTEKKKTTSRLSFHRPTRQSVWEYMYGENKSSTAGDFNHDRVGITNPIIDRGCDSGVNHCSVVKINEENVQLDKCWWPSHGNNTTPFQKNDWRILRYVCRVGEGEKCYRRVRNSMLDWEFQSESGTKGIIRAAPPDQRENPMKPFLPLPDRTNQNVIQLFSVPGRRRLTTYTQALQLPSFCSPQFFRRKRNVSPHQLKLFAMNPVAVVYDLIDQRGNGAKYTSTAYATLVGHWLKGEERVSVVIRDEDNFESVSSTTLSLRGDIKKKINQNMNTMKKKYVDVEILSYSRASSSLIGKVVWPLIGRLQGDFFLSQIKFLQQTALRRED